MKRPKFAWKYKDGSEGTKPAQLGYFSQDDSLAYFAHKVGHYVRCEASDPYSFDTRCIRNLTPAQKEYCLKNKQPLYCWTHQQAFKNK